MRKKLEKITNSKKFFGHFFDFSYHKNLKIRLFWREIVQNLPGQTGILFIISIEGVKLYKKPLRVFCLPPQDLGNFALLEEGIFSLISIALF